MATTDFSVKVSCQGENRRFTVLHKSTLDEFKKQCRTVFKPLQSLDFIVKYFDDEDDLITCEQEDEWVEAKRLTTRKNNLLKISLVPGQTLTDSTVSTRSTNTSSDISTDVKSVLSHLYKETESVTEDLVSEAVKLLSSLVPGGKKSEEVSSSQQSSSAGPAPEEFVLDASRDTLELKPKQIVEHASIQQQKQEEEQPKKPAPNPLEQSWTFIEVKDENHDDEEEEIPIVPVEPVPAEQEKAPSPVIVEEEESKPVAEPKQEEKQPIVAEPAVIEIPKLDAQFIADVTLPDGIKVESNQLVTKTWLLRNSGNVQWPVGTMMCYLNGPAHTVIELKFVHDVPRLNPNETTEISIQFKTSKFILGKQKGTFSLSDQFGKLFGQKFFFDIEVVEPKPAPAPVPVPVPIPAPQPVIPVKYENAIQALHSMGFCDDKKNIAMLEKHKGDLNLVVEALLS